jgi:hypothetical protein
MKLLFLLVVVVMSLTGCGESAYTLYRSSPVSNGGESGRIHIATFDAKEGEAYNMGNCQITQELFQKQQGISVRYWCEKGRFKK